MATIDLYRRAVSRRSLLREGAAFAAGAVALGLMAGASAASAAATVAKKPQNAVQYQQTPKGSARCNVCDAWQPPNGCKTVLGNINPTGWCNLYSAKW